MIGCHQDLKDKELKQEPGQGFGRYSYMLVKYFVSLLIICQDPLFPSRAKFPRKYFGREVSLGIHMKEYDQNTRKDNCTFKVKAVKLCLK